MCDCCVDWTMWRYNSRSLSKKIWFFSPNDTEHANYSGFPHTLYSTHLQSRYNLFPAPKWNVDVRALCVLIIYANLCKIVCDRCSATVSDKLRRVDLSPLSTHKENVSLVHIFPLKKRRLQEKHSPDRTIFKKEKWICKLTFLKKKNRKKKKWRMNECKKKLSLYCILYSTASQWANDYWNFVYRIRHLRISSSSSAHTQNTFWEFCCNFARVCVKLRKRWVPYAQPQADFRQFFFITFFFYFANQFFSVSKKFHFFCLILLLFCLVLLKQKVIGGR